VYPAIYERCNSDFYVGSDISAFAAKGANHHYPGRRFQKDNSMKPRWDDFITRQHGRKMGLVRHYSHLARYLLGLYSSLKRVEWSSVTRLVFVCKGNICRSPYAEARARAMGLACSSFGLEAGAHAPADPSAVRAARALGLDLAGHRTQRVIEFPMAKGDLLAAMEPWQAAVLQSRPIPVGAQVTLLGLWCRPSQPHIEDPLGLSDEYFQTCFATIDNALANMSALMQAKPVSNS
jgi:low molecular weight protein-tyrosine phosphatase